MYVRLWGPLWVYSTFSSESFNRNIVTAVTSPYHRADQIITRFLMRKFIIETIRVVAITERTETIIEDLLNASRVIVPPDMSEGHYFAGQGVSIARHPSEEEIRIIRNAGFHITAETIMRVYKKAMIHGVKYQVYDEIVRKFCDNIVFTKHGIFSIITSLIQYEDERNAIFGFIGKRMVDRGAFYRADYMRRVTASPEMMFAPYHDVITAGMFISIGEDICAVPVANCWEMD